jgi:phage gpG-like protein
MLKIDVDDSGLKVMLTGIQTGLNDLTPVWTPIHQIYIAFIKEQFASEGAYAGVKWEPLNKKYAAWKAQTAPGKTILRFRDRLYGSLTDEKHPEHVFRTGPGWMDYGTKVFYARIHQTGSVSVANRPPRRVVIPPMTQAEGERVVDAFQAYLFKKARTG